MTGPAFELRYRWFWLSVGFALILAVVAMSLWPSPPKTTLSNADKLVHLGAYFILMTWFGQIYRQAKGRLAWLICLCALGVLLEFVQGAVPTRSADAGDAAANAVGVVLGWLVTLGAGGRVLATLERKFTRDGSEGQT